MITAGDRLVQITGSSGQASTLLLMAGTGSTAGEALVDYSQLSTDTAANHLLAERAGGGGTWLIRARHRRRR